MKVQVEDRLTRIRTTVGKKPITAGSGPEFFRKLRGQRRDSRGGFLDFWCQIIEPFTVRLGDDEQVNRRLGRDVFEGQKLIVLVHYT